MDTQNENSGVVSIDIDGSGGGGHHMPVRPPGNSTSVVSPPPLPSIFPPAPAGTHRIPKSIGTEDYISVGFFEPGSKRTQERAAGVGSLFFDADAADWFLNEKVSHASPKIGEVDAKKAQKNVKSWLQSLDDDKLNELLDEHLARLVAALDWAGIEPTIIVRSGYGHHVHVWLDENTDQLEWAQKYTGAVIEAVNSQLGYDFLDAAANCGAPQLCREIGWQNTKNPAKPRTVRAVGGDTSARISAGSNYTEPTAELPGAEAVRAHVTALAAVFAPDEKGGKGKTGGGKSYNGKISGGGLLAATTPVTLAGGTSSTLGAVGDSLTQGQHAQCYCPQHSNTNTPAASVKKYDDGTVRLTCFGSCQATWQIADLTSMTFSAREATEAGNTENKSDEPRVSVTEYSTTELVGGKYLPGDAPTRRITALVAGQGFGKTESSIEIARAIGGRVGAIAPRRALVRDIVARSGGLLASYQDDSTDMSRDSVAWCIDSTHRVSTVATPTAGIGLVEETPFDIIILDEIRQLRRSMYSSKLRDPLRCWDRLQAVLRSAKHIIASDADTTSADLAWVAHMAGVTESEIEVRMPEAGTWPWSYRDAGSRIDVERELLEAVKAGEKCYVAVDSARYGETLAKLIEKENPGVRVVLASARTVLVDRVSKEKVDLSAINQWITNTDVVIATPVMQTGVSVHVPHVDRVFGIYGSPGIYDARDAMQSLHRVRSPRQSEIVVSMYGGTIDTTMTAGKIEQRERGLAKRTRGQATTHAVPFDSEGAPRDAAHLKWWAETEAEAHAGGYYGGLQLAFETLCNVRGYTYIGPPATAGKPDVAEKEARADIRDAIEDERVARIVSAADREDIEAEATDRQDLDELARAAIRDFYGVADVDEAIVRRDARGRYRRQMRWQARVRLQLDGKVDAVLHADVKRRGRYGRHEGLTTIAMKKVLAAYGLDLGKVVQGVTNSNIDLTPWTTFTPSDLQKGDRWVAAHLPALRALGLPKQPKGQPGWYFAHVLHQLGLRLDTQSKRTRIGGKRVRQIVSIKLDMTALTDALTYSQAEYDRLVNALDEAKRQTGTEVVDRMHIAVLAVVTAVTLDDADEADAIISAADEHGLDAVALTSEYRRAA